MQKVKLLLTVTAILLSWATAKAETICIQDVPNVGDETCTTTYNTGTPAQSNNLISTNWIDGSWVGTMFPDSSDINENIYLTGKHGKYAETTISSVGLMTEEEIKQGFTSTFSVQARWWNPQASTFTMSQVALDNLGNSTTQTILLEDTTNHNYEFNPYANTLIVSPNPNLTHGTITARFDFEIQGNKNYNGGHVGVDLMSPSMVVDYQTLTPTTSTSVKYCYEFDPPQCPGQDEINDVNDIIEDIQDINWEEDFYEADTITDYNPTDMPIDIIYMDEDINYGFETEEEVYELETENILVLAPDDFFFETEYEDIEAYEIDQTTDIDINEDIQLEETVYIEEQSIAEEETFNTEELITLYDDTSNTTDNVETGEINEPIEDIAYETTEEEFIEEPTQDVALLDEEPEIIEETPIEEAPEEINEEINEDTYQEEEEIYEEETEIIEDVVENEQPVDEEPQSEQPQETADEPAVEEESTEIAEEDSIEDVKIEKTKVAQIEEAIKSKVKDTTARIEATLTVVSEILNRDMIAQEADLSSYESKNAMFFDDRELPDGNQEFFTNQISLASYEYTIYDNQVSLGATDPVTQHEIKMDEYKSKTNKAYIKYMELKNANSI